jgi:hypothetical protein
MTDIISYFIRNFSNYILYGEKMNEIELKRNATEEITDNIWKTYRSMFNAYNRISVTYKLQKFSTIAIAIYILAVSIIILNTMYFTPEKISIYNIYLIILSVISLTLSLTIGESGNKVIANKFLACARELQHLYNSVLIKIEQNSNYKIIEEEKLYYEILIKYKLRQNQIDYQYLKFEKYKKNNLSIISLFFFHIKYFMFTKLLYILLLLIPLFGFVIIQII